MMKKILSLLLCLTMVLGFAVPAVQASGADNVYITENNISDFVVGDNVVMENVVVDGQNVGTPPSPTDLMSNTAVPAPMETPAQPVAPASCDCDSCVSIDDHTADCVVRARYHMVCADTAESLMAVWADYSAEEQAYMLRYMQENLSGRYADFMKLLNAPTGSATETYVDGTTVSVEGIPEDGSVTIQEASDEVKEIVSEVVAKQESAATELFTYDVSVQDDKGADWQPEDTVKMELEVPGKKLHKYSKVYVVHVDDNGVASTIEAEVTEDGKIAFETPGFSTFAGFTVDFDYEGATFSIPGMSSIKLSELFENLKMPLNAEDVVNLEYTDYEQIKIEKLEGDWLLTSLKAFDTEEKLTMTMNDGTVYGIKVTDANFATTAYIYVGGTQADTDRNGECTWYLSGANGEVGTAYFGHNWATNYGGSYADGWSSSSTIEIRGPGTFQINLQHQQKSDYYDRAYWGGDSCALEVNIRQIKITGGAKLVFRLGGDFSGKEASLTIKGTADVPIFDIQDGSLYFCVSSNNEIALPAGASASFFGTGYADGHIPVYLDGQDKATGATSPLIYHHQGKDEDDRQNLIVEDVTFENAKHRAVLVQTNNMTNLNFRNCTFASTVRSVKYGGGAIYIDGGTDTSYNGGVNAVNVDNFTLTNCTFSGNTGASGHGGAIASYGDIYKLYVNGCTFKNCTSANRAGAIELSVNDTTATNHIFNWIKFENTKFTNCTAASHGGAIDISNGDNPLKLASNITISGCTFTNCKATGNRGGAIRMVVGPTEHENGTTTPRNLVIENTGISGCTAGSAGGAISVQGTIGNVSISGYKTDGNGNYTIRNCSSNDHGGGLLVDCSAENIRVYNAVISGNSCSARGAGVALLCPTVGNITIGSSVISNNTAGTLGGGFFVGIRASASGPITAGDVSVTGSVFSGNRADGVGGCLSLTDGTYNSVTVQSSSFSDSYAANYGGAIGLKVYADDSTEKFPVKVTNAVQVLDCTFTNCNSGGLSPDPYDHDGDPATANKTTWDHDGDSSTAEIARLNGTGGGGAIAIGAEVGGGITIKSTGSTNSTAADDYTCKFINCNTWNNGGAVCFTGIVKTKNIDLQYVLIDGCRARDAGGAIHLSNLIADNLKMDTCTVRNCSYFTQDFNIDIPGTDYDSLGKKVYVAYDASGTFRCIGNTTCRAHIYNCTFRNNNSYSNGGGVYWNANNIRTGAGGTTITPSLKIEFSVFDGNHAERDGGGLYVEATVQVYGSHFYNNTVNGRGGAIAQQVYNNEARTLGTGEATNLQLNSSTIIYNNTAQQHGGGISITVSKTVSIADGTNLLYPVQFTLGGASVYNNKAVQHGGGIYYSTTTYEDALAQREVDNFQKEILINNGKIYNNISGYYDETDSSASSRGGSGGGVYMSSNQVNTGDGTGYSKVTISSGAIYSNKAIYGNGGGIHLEGINALCNMEGGVIGATATTDGKPDTAYPNTATFGKVEKLDDNDNPTGEFRDSGGNGGGISVFDGARIVMSDGYVVNNVSDVSGGGIAVHGGTAADKGGSTMYITNGYVENNRSHIGGGISLNAAKGDSTSTEDATKYGMYFNGGYVKNNIVTPDANNNNYALGGGICISAQSTMKLDANAEITGNIASTDGTDAAFAANQEGGGIAVCQGSTMEINGGKIAENKAYDGGGLCIRGDSIVNMEGSLTVNDKDVVTASNGVIVDNIAYHNGGGAYLGAYVTSAVNHFYLNDGWIYSNEAGNCGGGVYVGTYNGFELNGGRIDENIAKTTTSKTGGGGVFGLYSVIKISDGVMKGNLSYADGGAVLDDHGTLIISGGTLKENIAKGSGGAVYGRRSKQLNVTNGNIESNYAMFGGGMFLYGSTADISGGCIITKNLSNQGAGLFVRSGKVTIGGGTISYNHCKDNANYDSFADKNGGGIHVDNTLKEADALVTINGGVIEYNTAPTGGGIWIRNNETAGYCPTVVMNGGNVQYNTANGNGGGIYIDGGNYIGEAAADGTRECTSLTMNGGTITNNTASGNGGGVYVCGKAVTTITKGIVNNKEVIGMITHNTGRNGGGVFVTTGGDLTVNEGHITFNKAVGMPASTIKSAYHQYANLKGTGGGIAVANAASTDAQAKFTLKGSNMAIYGNTADFAADDVYANGYATLLDVPQVASMNLTGYNFKPEAWFEDYSVNDNCYSYGTNLGGDKGVVNGNVLRYRGAASSLRIQLTEANVTNLVKAANKYICMTLGIPAAVNDIVVSDFGLQMKINVIENDVILSSGEIISGGVLSKTGPSIDNKEKIFEYNGVVYGGLDSNFKSGTVSLDLTHGTAELNTTTGQIIYKLKTSTFKMDSEDTFHYAVFHLTPNATDGYYYYGQVTVVPATTIYYEDNCGGIEYINGSQADGTYGTWKNVKDNSDTDTDLGNKYQGEDRPGAMIIPGTDTDYIYGYDALYNYSGKYSAGGAKVVRVTEGKDASAVFTFKGTGFDVISLSSGNTGSVMVSIYEGNKVDSTKLYESTMVDTYYGCTTNFYKVTYYYSSYKDNAGNVCYKWMEATKEPITEAQMKPNSAKPAKPKEGDSYVAYESRIEADPNGNGDTLYQVPVIHRTGLEYGTYTVELYIGWTWWLEMNRPNYDWMDFYLDAIRIYDPADNGNSSETVKNAYKQDAEGWPVYRELRNYLISADQFSNITDGSITGAVVIDGNPALSSSANNGTDVEDENDPLYNLSPEIVDYANFGPNNEVYLQNDQAIAFHLDSSELQLPEGAEIAAVRLGIKSTKQGSKYKIYDPSTTTLADAKVVSLWTTTDMFYDITEFMDKDVVIYCDTNAFDKLSITDLKITFTENPYGTNASGEMNGEIPGLDNLLVMSARTAQLAVASMETPVEEAPVPVLTPKYPTLSFEGEISYNFYFTAENLGTLTEEKLGLMVFDTADAEGSIDTCTYALTGAKQEDGMYVVATEGIAAKNLGDKLYFKLFAQMDDGSYVYSKLFSYSAVDYAKSVLNSATASAKQKTLVAAMLRYGAEAQNYFGHNTDSLMDSILTEDHLNLLAGFSADSLNAVTPADSAKVADFAATETFGKAYPTVSFEGAFQVQYYFAPEHQPAGEVTMYYWSEDTYASCETLTDENADEVITAELVDGQYVAVSPEIAAKELDQTLYVAAVYESEGVSYCSGVLAYSLAAYCKSHANDSMGSFATAAAVYGCAAKNYFEQ